MQTAGVSRKLLPDCATERTLNVIKHIFVVNPKSGKGVESTKLIDVIKDACSVASADYEIYITKAPGDATVFVREKISQKQPSEIYRFYACGGDGTLSEVVSGAVNLNSAEKPEPLCGVEVGCIPVGTGNDFVRNFTHSKFFLDITKQLLADTIVIDSYLCRYDGNERYGINMINIGFDCETAAKVADIKKKRLIPKGLAYIAGVIATLKENPGVEILVKRSDGSSIKREFELVAVANGGWCGGGFHSAPKSSLTDGKLDISLIKKVSRTTLLQLIGSYKKGTHLATRLGKKVVAYLQEETVSFAMDKEANICLDGEIIRASELSLTVLPRSLAFVLPVGCRYIQ